MVGREVQLVGRPRREPSRARSCSRSRTCTSRTTAAARSCDDVSFEVRPGEIFGIAGVAGNGQDELVEAITGLRRPSGGHASSLDGVDVTGDGPRTLHEQDVSFVPGGPPPLRARALLPLADNLILNDYYAQPYSRGIVRDEAAILTRAEEAIAQFDVRTPSRRRSRPARCRAATSRRSSSPASSTATCKLLVLDQPTRGLDVGSIEFIHKQIIAQARRGHRRAARLRRAGRGPGAVRPHRASCTAVGSSAIVDGRDGQQGGDRPAHGDGRSERSAGRDGAAVR